MEERIIDDEFGRGIRLKKTKDGYVDVEDELAPETENEDEVAEEIEVILPVEGEQVCDEEKISYSMPVVYSEVDDEDLVDLSPEAAERVRKEKAEAIRRRQEAYKSACEEGEKLLATGSFHAAELVFEKALALDELATQASVGYWRAKTANFTDPDALVEEYLEEGVEQLESDLGVIATEIIKREHRGAFEKRFQELSEQEAPILREVEEKQAQRRVPLSQRRFKTFVLFLCSSLPFFAAVIATVLVGLKNFSTPDDTFILPTIVCGSVALVTFFLGLIATNQFFNACRMYNMNENLSSTDEGKAVLEIREYKSIYEALLCAPQTEIEEESEETDEE